MIKTIPTTITEQVIKLLIDSEYPTALTIENCAAKLAMSMTSFRRKLKQEETSYKLLQNKYLNELCVQELLTNNIKVETLAEKLGYSERATFERAFKNKFAITPAKFSELSTVDSQQKSYQRLVNIAQSFPPLSESCQQLLLKKNDDSLDLKTVVQIVERDPVFYGRVMGLASKAIYGRSPKNLQDAIGRNIGIDMVINIAISNEISEALQDQVSNLVVDQYIEAFLIAPKVFHKFRRSLGLKIDSDSEYLEQVLSLSLIGILLLSHKKSFKSKAVLHAVTGLADLHSLNIHVKQSMGISVFSASTLMLSLWHIDAELIKRVNDLDLISQSTKRGSSQTELILFTLSFLYMLAVGHNDFCALEEKAQLLGIFNFDEIRQAIIGE